MASPGRATVNSQGRQPLGKDLATASPGRATGSKPPTPRATWTRPLPQAILAGGLAGLVYLLTLTPSIAWGDSPELVTGARMLGVAHPTGYPLYMLLGHLWQRLAP